MKKTSPISTTPGLTRRGFCAAAVATVAAGRVGLLGFAEGRTAMNAVAQHTGTDKSLSFVRFM